MVVQTTKFIPIHPSIHFHPFTQIFPIEAVYIKRYTREWINVNYTHFNNYFKHIVESISEINAPQGNIMIDANSVN